MVTLVIFILLFISFAMLFSQGLWNNLITLLCLITSGLVATSLFEPVANFLEHMEPTYTYLCDFVAIWLVFCVTFVVLRVVTSFLSTTQVRFKQPINLGGSIFLASWISWVLVGFTLATLHVAPLHRNFFKGAFQPEPESRMFFGLAPDQQWLAFVQKVSRGSLATSPPEDEPGEDGRNVFDRRGEFILKYSERRAQFQKAPAIRVYREVK